jgi:hypothetical protein
MIVGAVGGTVLSGVVVLGAAYAGQSTTKAAAAPTVNCPSVNGALPAVPAQSQAEVTRNLALLDTQITEANNRLASTVGQGGPNFINNAILGPLKDKRTSTLDRIAISIGRHAAKPTGLDALAACTLSTAGGTAATASPTAAATTAAAATATAAATAPAATSSAATTGQTIVCPDVAAQLAAVAVPVAAQAEVTRNLALLQTQITEANNRLASSVGQGGPNFVNNAILGPLKDKRSSTIDRINLAFSRQGATAPTGLNALAGCALSG